MSQTPIVVAMLTKEPSRQGKKRFKVIAQPVAKGIVELEVYCKGRIARVRLNAREQDALANVFTNSRS